MSEAKYFSLLIERMPDGGFIVVDGSFRREPGNYAAQLFAATTIDEALKFMRDKLSPTVGAQIGGLHTLKGDPITQEQMDAQMGYRPKLS